MINRRVLIKLHSLLLNSNIKQRTFSLHCTLQGKPIVSSHNEWDPLEEIILGRIEGATIPEYDITLKPTTPPEKLDLFRNNAGQSFPLDVVDKAKKELDYFARVLESEGVTVRRPEVNATRDFCTPFKTPDFSCKAAIHAAMPRDSLLVVGDEIIEAPMSWRSRYFEFRSFRPLIKEYFKVKFITQSNIGYAF
jgi:glycine amidinotransferase